MAVIKNHKTGMWEVRTYYKDLTGARKQKMFFVKHFSLKKASEFPVFSEGFFLL